MRGSLLTGLFLAIVLVLSGAALNFGARLAFRADDFQRTHLNGIRIVEYALKERPDIYGEDSRILPHPYLLYALKPNFSDGAFLQTDENGYRIVPQPARPSSAKRRRILVLGGSTTFSYPYVPNPANAWPSQLQKILGPEFEVVNAGISSATSAELLAGYVFRHRYLKPDVVVIHEGGNDVLAMLFDRYDPEYRHFRAAGTRPVPGPLDRALLKWGGWPAKMLYAHNWNDLPTVVSWAPSALSEISPSDALHRALNAPTTGFDRNIDMLVKSVIADGGTPILFGFVEAREPLLSRNRPDLVGKERALVTALERNLAVMKRIAADRGIVYLDPHDFKTSDDWFLDNCHLNEVGEAAKAAFVAAALRKPE